MDNNSRVTKVVLALVIGMATLARSQTETVLHRFTGSPNDGALPYAVGLVIDSNGNLYGTTQQGGDGSACYPYAGCGTVFELRLTGNRWKKEVLYNFQGGSDGANPAAGLIVDSSGNLYGTTTYGGTGCGFGCGTVFELSPTSRGWQETVLHRFTSSDPGDAARPQSPLTMGRSGTIYGTTPCGGNPACSCGCGAVFEMTPSEGRWLERVIYAFNGDDGFDAYAGVTLDIAGAVYGTTMGGGNGSGLVFQLTRHNKSVWYESILYEFPYLNGSPRGGVTLDKEGNVYGAAINGGEYGSGCVFELTRPRRGEVAWAQTTLYSFTGGSDGAVPGAVIFDQAGNLYGMTGGGGDGYSCQGWCGVVFKLRHAGGTWTETVLYGFQGGDDGEYPDGPLVFDAEGNLYGTTPNGGDPNCSAYSAYPGCGVVFKISR
jgi:uncharacterized repeat protein (TIGR03803 family)